MIATGLKPAGLDRLVIPLAEAAMVAVSVVRLADFLADAVRHEAEERFEAMLAAAAGMTDGEVPEERTDVQEMLGLQVWAHKLYEAARRRSVHA